MLKPIFPHYRQLVLAALVVSQASWSNTINFSGAVTSKACTFSLSETTVTLPTVDAYDVPGSARVGLTGMSSPAFSIIADCPSSLAGTTLRVNMSGATNFADSAKDRVVQTDLNTIGLGLGMWDSLSSSVPTVFSALPATQRTFVLPGGTTELPVFVVPVYHPIYGKAAAGKYTAALNVTLTGA